MNIFFSFLVLRTWPLEHFRSPLTRIFFGQLSKSHVPCRQGDFNIGEDPPDSEAEIFHTVVRRMLARTITRNASTER